VEKKGGFSIGDREQKGDGKSEREKWKMMFGVGPKQLQRGNKPVRKSYRESWRDSV